MDTKDDLESEELELMVESATPDPEAAEPALPPVMFGDFKVINCAGVDSTLKRRR